MTEVFGGLVDDVGAAGGAAGVGTEGDREDSFMIVGVLLVEKNKPR